MSRHFFNSIMMALVLSLALAANTSAATIGPSLQSKLAGLAHTASVGTVVIAFNTNNGLQESHLNIVRGRGILSGVKLEKLGMVAVNATAGQVRARDHFRQRFVAGN
ncbi:MAG TPA: hypothetical protein VNA19_03580 [Pyrinomonadaceae bacterium]|jgi:hypothetical protein|nr:hypothetical protein [Pyrinomonadaceae bacterium]